MVSSRCDPRIVGRSLWLLGLLLISQGRAFLLATNTRDLTSVFLLKRIQPKCIPLDVVSSRALNSEVALDQFTLYPDEDASADTHEKNLELAKLAKQCGSGGRQSQSLALKAYDILQNMTCPDTVAYNIVINAFAKSAPATFPLPSTNSDSNRRVSAAERAEGLLDEMMTIYDTQSSAQHTWYKNRAKGELTHDEINRGPPIIRVKPNVRSFSTVMDAWSRMGRVQETLQVLKVMEEMYEETMDGSLKPNSFSYNTVLSAFAKSRGGKVAAEQAQHFLEHNMPNPDVISYNAVLSAWARSGVPQAGSRAEDLLRGMRVTPNAKSYASVMDAWSRSGTDESAARAHGLLKELQELYDRTGDEELCPNCICYTSVIHAYALSKEALKAQRAYALLQEMKDKGQTDTQVLPNTVTYNSVLNACATSSPLTYSEINKSKRDSSAGKGGEPSLQTMIQTLYQELVQVGHSESTSEMMERESVSPDHFTFGTILKACANNIFWNDPNFGMTVFQEACRRGQVSLGVLIQLRHAYPSCDDFLPSKAYNPQTRKFDIAYIPEAWKRNVRERADRRPLT